MHGRAHPFARWKRAALWLVVLSVSGCGCEDDEADTGDGGVAVLKDVGVQVNDARARACDVLVLEDGVWDVDGVRFDDSVLGEWERWGPRAAFSFSAKEDASMGDVAKVTFRSTQGGDPSYERVETQCYDRAGQLLEGADVSIR